MDLNLFHTLDDSYTLYNKELDETYHSRNGALEESKHVFIQAGLQEILKTKADLNILEVGFGTGLNAILTLADTINATVFYHGLETTPLPYSTIEQLNYLAFIPASFQERFREMHLSSWNNPIAISKDFTLFKDQTRLQDFQAGRMYDLVYFDAFAPDKQPELWTAAMFENIYQSLNPGGIIVTYSSKGEVRRSWKQIGFEVERLPGPPRKRHMLRGTKHL